MRILIIAAVASVLSFGLQAEEHHHSHDHTGHFSRAPAGVMGDHVHGSGDWMFSYRYMGMHMDGLRDGTASTSTAQVLEDFMVAPLRMDMEMHMFGLMYAFSDEFTLMAMVPLVSKDMDHITRMGERFTTRSDGVGDTRLSGVYVLSRSDQRQVLLNMGVSVPTGDIDAKDDTPAMDDALLPYAMQLGSGTWDLLPGLTYTAARGAWAWGGQLLATVRLGDNDNDYAFGNRLEMNGWATRRLGRSWGLSLRLHGEDWDNIDGRDKDLNPLLVPTADADRQAGRRIALLAGANFFPPAGVLGGNRLALEAGVPVYEDLDGPQMSADWVMQVGWQWVF